MLTVDPIKPCLWLLKAGLWTTLAGGLFVTGCNHGKDRQKAEDQAEIAAIQKRYEKADSDAQDADRRARACGQLLSDVNDQSLRQIEDAKRAKDAAEQAANRATAAAQAGERRAKAAEQALQAAKTTPACRSQLEIELCPVIPLL